MSRQRYEVLQHGKSRMLTTRALLSTLSLDASDMERVAALVWCQNKIDPHSSISPACAVVGASLSGSSLESRVVLRPRSLLPEEPLRSMLPR